MSEDLKTKFESIRARYEKAAKSLDSGTEYENFSHEMADVVEDMGWVLENFMKPGVLGIAMSIASHARQHEREIMIAVLELMRDKQAGEDSEIKIRLGDVAQGAVLGTLQAAIEALREQS